MCKFCKKIFENVSELDGTIYTLQRESYTNKEIETMQGGLAWEDDVIILYIPCDDNYYTPKIKDVKFCPYCGRELK